MTLVNIEDLVKNYPIGGGHFTALDNINLAFEKGEFCGLVGPSGSGKTTLLNIIGSLDNPSKGAVTVLGERISNLSERKAARLRSRHMGFIFQTYNLLPVYTVFENVEFPLLLMGMSAEERRSKVMDALEWVGLTDKKDSRPGQISGGQAQRVSIARAMVKLPKLVLADEPTANLDAENSRNVMEMMVKLNRELKTTFLFATHDEKVIRYLRRKITLFDGQVSKDERDLPGLGRGASEPNSDTSAPVERDGQ